ncbi:Fc receptor-like protein 5 [Dasypus novemcinctus]|uniref:Fc receptor-like protein 5 n=1 Tax=Dasypus novemcinctus TaxID=9361 RepID=UPI00265F4C5E|nr:Fc receptor-like protein 5 [Dasypus novemcinctus]
MLLWVSLLVLAPVSEQLATISKPVIILSPPWTVVFQGETVLLTCKGFHDYSTVKTKWYHQHSERETPGNTLEVHNSGEYRCQIRDSPHSNPVKVMFTSASLILQAPHSVFEGDLMVLRCLANKDVLLNNWTFYRNGKVLRGLSNDSNFTIHEAHAENNGRYRCSGSKELHNSVSSNTVHIQVQDLFPRPELKVSTSQPTEGSQVTLTCETPLPLQRSEVLLQFRFYSDAWTLESGWSSSPEIQITMWSEHSGNYWCKAVRVSTSVEKQSSRYRIAVKIPVSHPVLTLRTPKDHQALESDKVTLHCEAQRGSLPILYQFFHESIILKSIEVRSRRSASFSLSVTAEHSGNYHCTADNGLGAQSSEAVSLSVTVPVSQPVLTLRMPRAQALEGDRVTLHCEAQRGSPRILYQLFHEGKLLGSSSAPSGGGASFSLSLTTEHSGNYHCTAENGFHPQYSKAVSLSVMVLVSRPVLTLLAPKAPVVVGDVVELRCEAQRGSPPILYKFYHEYVTLGSSSVPSGGRASFNLCLTAEHSGNYYCTADNGLGIQRSDTVPLNVTVPVSRPVLNLRTARAQAVVGDVAELHCEIQRGSPPILYRFYHNDVTLESSSAPAGGGASFSFSLTAEHSGNYSCEAENVLGAQRSQVVPLNITIPVSRPVLTLRVPGAQAVVGDVVELHCEAERGSPPILYRFYHEDVTLGNSSTLSGGGVSFNISLTAEHSGNYSCEADNGLGAQHSEVVTLNIRGLTGSRSGPVATGVTGGLLSMMGLAAVALLVYCRFTRKAGEKFASDPTRSPASLDTRASEPTYHNVPASIELQPVYSNVNPNGSDVVYSEVQCIQKKMKAAATTTPGLLKDKDSSVIYSQVKGASALAS